MGEYNCPHCGGEVGLTFTCPKCGAELEVESWDRCSCPKCGAEFKPWESSEMAVLQ